MGLINSVGNYMIVKEVSNGHVTIEIYKDEASVELYKTNPIPELEPMRSNIYIGTKFTDAQKIITSLDGKTLAEKNQSVLEQVVMDALVENYSILPRIKFEESDWILV